MRIASHPVRKIYKHCINRVTDVHMGTGLPSFSFTVTNSPQRLPLYSCGHKGSGHPPKHEVHSKIHARLSTSRPQPIGHINDENATSE